jgi:hypothetical protein
MAFCVKCLCGFLDNRCEPSDIANGVDCNTANSVRVTNPFGTLFTFFAGTQFQLFDGDDFNDDDGTLVDGDTLPSPGEDISEPDIGLLTAGSDDPDANVFATAYIRPVYDVIDPTDNSYFQPNAFTATPQDRRSMFIDRDLTSTDADVQFWTVYVLGAYQGEIEEDKDPSDDDALFGIADGIPTTSFGDGSGVLIFSELHNSREILDYPNDPSDPSLRHERTTVAHEVGHLLSGQHGDGGLMTNGAGLITSSQFSNVSIRRIRAELLHP